MRITRRHIMFDGVTHEGLSKFSCRINGDLVKYRTDERGERAWRSALHFFNCISK